MIFMCFFFHRNCNFIEFGTIRMKGLLLLWIPTKDQEKLKLLIVFLFAWLMSYSTESLKIYSYSLRLFNCLECAFFVFFALKTSKKSLRDNHKTQECKEKSEESSHNRPSSKMETCLWGSKNVARRTHKLASSLLATKAYFDVAISHLCTANTHTNNFCLRRSIFPLHPAIFRPFTKVFSVERRHDNRLYLWYSGELFCPIANEQNQPFVSCACVNSTQRLVSTYKIHTWKLCNEWGACVLAKSEWSCISCISIDITIKTKQHDVNREARENRCRLLG